MRQYVEPTYQLVMKERNTKEAAPIPIKAWGDIVVTPHNQV